MTLQPLHLYAREVRAALPREAFAPSRRPLLWLALHGLFAASAIFAIASGRAPWFLSLALAPLLGLSFGAMGFVAHETLHGAVVRGRRARLLVGWVGFLPFVISPRLWVAWHNRVHHGHTAQAGIDPDAYPSLDQYEHDRQVRFVTDNFAMGGRRFRGALSLMLGFTVQSALRLKNVAELGMSDRDRRLAVVETALGVALWSAVACVAGPWRFLLAFVVPLLMGNVLLMAHILTNHNLSPQTDVNDPLVNSLSVTVPGWLGWLTLNFGNHVEHHLFPAMSYRHTPAVRSLLLARWPDRYQSMPLGKALKMLHATGRVYEASATLSDPRTAGRWPALEPRAEAHFDQDSCEPRGADARVSP